MRVLDGVLQVGGQDGQPVDDGRDLEGVQQPGVCVGRRCTSLVIRSRPTQCVRIMHSYRSRRLPAWTQTNHTHKHTTSDRVVRWMCLNPSTATLAQLSSDTYDKHTHKHRTHDDRISWMRSPVLRHIVTNHPQANNARSSLHPYIAVFAHLSSDT